MPAGNFAASYVFAPEGSPAQAALYSFVASLALHDVLSSLTNKELTLKWPNDVVVPTSAGSDAERKLAGILTEMEGEADRVSWVVVGIGVRLHRQLRQGVDVRPPLQLDHRHLRPPSRNG